MTKSQRGYQANLVGALCLTVADRMREAVTEATGFAGEAAGALVTIDAEPGKSIGFIADVVGLTHSGTVRLLDKLEADGLVKRKPGQDGRTAALWVTRLGKRRVRGILDARAAALDGLLQGLTSKQVAALAELSKTVLRDQLVDEMDEHIICRLCDTAVCYRKGCPLEP